MLRSTRHGYALGPWPVDEIINDCVQAEVWDPNVEATEACAAADPNGDPYLLVTVDAQVLVCEVASGRASGLHYSHPAIWLRTVDLLEFGTDQPMFVSLNDVGALKNWLERFGLESVEALTTISVEPMADGPALRLCLRDAESSSVDS